VRPTRRQKLRQRRRRISALFERDHRRLPWPHAEIGRQRRRTFRAGVVDIKAGGMVVRLALPNGRRRWLRARRPALVSVGRAAPAPRQSAFAKARRGRIVPHAVSHAVPASDLAAPPWTAAPAKPRPKRLKAVDPNASAEERLKAITEMSGGQGEVLVGLSPDAAAGRLLDYLVEAGAVPHTQTALDLEKPAT
ncbi:MAG: hypothetical protein AAGC95_17920, partial [Pseudomonadota bacterium]